MIVAKRRVIEIYSVALERVEILRSWKGIEEKEQSCLTQRQNNDRTSEPKSQTPESCLVEEALEDTDFRGFFITLVTFDLL